MSLLIKGGRVVDPAAGLDGYFDILVEEDLIAGIMAPGSEPVAADEVYEAGGRLVLPGLVDLHVHFGEPGREERETIKSGTMAAARGGFTTVLMMPDTEPPLDDPAVLAQALDIASRKSAIRVLAAGALSKELAGREMTELAGLVAAGATGLVEPDRLPANKALLRRILQYAAPLGAFIAVHPVEYDLLGSGVMHEGAQSTAFGIPGIPAAAEEVAVAACLLLIAATGTPLHLSGISTAGSVRLIARAKEDGLPVTCDTSPYHLVLTDEYMSGYEASGKLLPPLRPPEDVAALVAGLTDGTIDCVATNHTPYPPEEKDIELDKAPFGAVALEVAWPLLYHHLVREGRLSLRRLVEAMSAKPAALLGLAGKGTGTLRLGGPADLVIVNPEAQKVVQPESFCSKGRSTPVSGRLLSGWPEATVAGGRLVWRESR
ncbi:MAG TPA: dihydroorotase [Firmicutes bacterium]|nr:dihydroorotase [Bacillota bacterium]